MTATAITNNPAAQLVTDADLADLLNTIDTIRGLAVELLAQRTEAQAEDGDADGNDTPSPQLIRASRTQSRLFAHAAQLRTQYRQVVMSVRETKGSTAETRKEVDGLRLHLQNLVYEARHLRGEIRGCLEFDHKYSKLPLVSETEFDTLFPDRSELSQHDKMKARIEHEHGLRTALEEERQTLVKRKNELLGESNRKKDDLANLDKDLEKFLEAADPILKKFDK